MLDQCTGSDRRAGVRRARRARGPSRSSPSGWPGTTTWGTEAVMLSAGTAVEWLRDDLGIIAAAPESETLAARCATSGDVWFVPALLGLGTPVWDFGARGTLVGLTRGSGRPEIVRAVLEGVAHRGADLVEASERGQRLPDHRPAHRRRHVGQRGLRRGTGRRHRAPGRDLTRRWRRRRSAPASWPGWPSAPTRRPTSSRAPSRPGEPLSLEVTMRVGPPTASAGWPPGRRPKPRSLSSRASPSERNRSRSEGDCCLPRYRPPQVRPTSSTWRARGCAGACGRGPRDPSPRSGQPVRPATPRTATHR